MSEEVAAGRPRKKKDPLSAAGATLAAVAAALFRLVLLPAGLSSFLVWIVLALVFVVAGLYNHTRLVAPLLGVWVLLAASVAITPASVVGAVIALAAGTFAFGVESYTNATYSKNRVGQYWITITRRKGPPIRMLRKANRRAGELKRPGLKNLHAKITYEQAIDSFRDGWNLLASPKDGLPDSLIVEVGNVGQPTTKVKHHG